MTTVHALCVCTGFKSSGQISNGSARCWKPCAGTMDWITCVIPASQVPHYLLLRGLHILVKFSMCFMMKMLFLFFQTSMIQKDVSWYQRLQPCFANKPKLHWDRWCCAGLC